MTTLDGYSKKQPYAGFTDATVGEGPFRSHRSSRMWLRMQALQLDYWGFIPGLLCDRGQVT